MSTTFQHHNQSSNSTGTLYLNRTIFEAWIGVTLLQSLIGIVGMVLLLIAILSKPSLRRQTGILIAHLTCIELVILAIHSNINLWVLIKIQNRERLPGYWDCDMTHAFYASFIFAGNWSMCIIALNRFVAFVFPHHFKYLTTKAVIVSMLLFSWFLAFGEMWPLYFGIGGIYGLSMNRGCDLVRADAGAYFQSVLVLYFYLPLSLMVVAYAIIFVILQCQKRRAVLPNGEQRSARKRMRTTRMLFGCSIWYFLCYIPGPICIAAFFEEKSREDSMLFLWTRVVALAGNSGSPVIAFAMNVDYRNSIAQFFSRTFNGFKFNSKVSSSSAPNSNVQQLRDNGTPQMPSVDTQQPGKATLPN